MKPSLKGVRIELFSPFASLIKFRGFIREAVIVETTLRYRGSAIGLLWSLLNPILQAIVIYFVFNEVFRMVSIGTQEYFTYVYSGVLLAHFFTQTILLSGEQIFAKSSLLIQTKLPLEVFVATTIIVNTINFVFGLIPLILYLLLFKGTFPLSIVFLPLLLFIIWTWLYSLGILLNSIYIRFVDLRFLLPVLTSFLFYLTPVYYDLSSMSGLARDVISSNPLTFMLIDFRFLLGLETEVNLEINLGILIIGLLSVPMASYLAISNKKLLWNIQ